MKIACLGGGPAGLYFAISMKLRDAGHDITVFERNRADDTFGWGVVFSDETFDNIAANDPPSAATIRVQFRLLGRHRRPLSRPERGVGRPRLLRHRPQEAAHAAAGARARTRREACASRPKSRAPPSSPHLTISSSRRTGLIPRRAPNSPRISSPPSTCARTNSSGSARGRNSTTPSPSSSRRPRTAGSGRTPISSTPTPRPSSSSARAATWEKFGFGAMSQDETCRTCERIFAKYLGGHPLMSNASAPARLGVAEFSARAVREVVAQKYRADGRRRRHRAFLHRLRHQARHGERGRAWPITCTASRPCEAAFAKYENARRTEVLRLQSAARNSLEWFEDVERYLHLDPVQFNYSLLTRSQRISHENLRLRDRRWLEGAEAWFQHGAGAADNVVRRPMFAPFTLARHCG